MSEKIIFLMTVKKQNEPAYEGYQAVGAPAEELRQCWVEPMMDALAKPMNPKAQWKYIQHRSSEQIIVE